MSQKQCYGTEIREKVSAAAHMTSHMVEESMVVPERNENHNSYFHFSFHHTRLIIFLRATTS